MISVKNDFGIVTFHPSVFAKIALNAAESFGGRLMITNSSGKPVKTGDTGKEPMKFVEASVSDQGTVSVKVFLIVRFGTSISGITKEFTERLKEEAQLITGVVIDTVITVVTGVISKNIAKRNLELTY